MSAGYHLFALIRADAVLPAPLPAGLEGGSVVLLSAGPVTAVAQAVTTQFVARLQQDNGAESERAWLTERLLEHERVVESFATPAPTFPLGFGVLLADPSALQTAIVPHASSLSDFFARAVGHQEWSLKFFLREQAPRRGEMAVTARSGLEYLAARHALPERTAAREAAGREFVENVLKSLSPFYEDIVVNKSGAAPDRDLRLLANIALLVPTRDQDTLISKVQAFLAIAETQDMELTLTGPWPLYSFRPSITLG